MKADLIAKAAVKPESSEHSKIRTHFAKIIVSGNAEKPCYDILYFNPIDEEYQIGFGSYCLEYVFKWLEEEFEIIEAVPTVDAVEVPCKIGDTVWAIRNFKGRRQAQKGVVSEMYFRKDMTLQIVVGYVARGKWGEVVFATQADAEAALNGERREDDG